eukprot:7765619-Pyramimonas_sp.AAC.1
MADPVPANMALHASLVHSRERKYPTGEDGTSLSRPNSPSGRACPWRPGTERTQQSRCRHRQILPPPILD